MDTQLMILDELMPLCDLAIAEHRIVDADPGSTYRAACDLDFAAVHTPLLDLAFFARSVPARLRGRNVPPPPQVRLSGGADGGLPGWMLLGQRPGQEIAFGAVGVFWRGEIRWRNVPAEAFTAFTEPGNGKVVCNFSVRPYGVGRSLLSYECRVTATDSRSRQAVNRYWLVIRPFVGHIMRAALAAVADDATRPAVPAGT